MNAIRILAVLCALAPVSAWAQGVRMTADFLPLDVGTRWTYGLVNERGETIGQMAFAVEEYTIVEGTSFYVLSSFPFSSESADDVRYVRYDRSERYFVRKLRDNEGPLFLSDNSETEVTETDSGGAPLKFVLRTPSMALTFERGVGIIQATMDGPDGPVTARLTDFRPKDRVSVATPPSPAAPTAGAPSPSRDTVLIPPPLPPNRRESPVASVSEANPQVSSAIVREGDHYNLVLVLVNTADKLLPFTFRSGQTYDFSIRDAAGNEVWRWSDGNFFTQVVRSDAIRAKSKWQFQETWNRRDNSNQLVPPGRYQMVATLAASPALVAEPVTFEIP